MAVYTQLSGEYCLDYPFKNYGGTDIPAGTAVLLDTTAGNLKGVVVPTSSGGPANTIGITIDVLKAGMSGRVRVVGSAVATAHGAITAGQVVQADDTASYLGQVKVCGAGLTQIGIALTTAADQDPVEVLLHVARNA